MRHPPAVQFDPPPPDGRRFGSSRRVQVAAAAPNGRLRLDAIADMAQDLASDDTADADLGRNSSAWVVRRTVIVVEHPAAFGEELALTTWCSGVGSRWAERRTSFVGDRGGRIEVAALWVHIDPTTGRAVPLPKGFDRVWGSTAAGRVVSSRFQHDSAIPPDARTTPWIARFVDFDVLGHVNNAATWAMVEQAIVDHDGPRAPHRAELEYRLPIERGDEVAVAVAVSDGALQAWAVDPADASRVYATAIVSRSAR